MKAALIGLPQSGKSTILSAISGKASHHAGVAAIEDAVVPVPDERLNWLTELYKPKKTTTGTIDCLDLPGFNFSDEHGRTAARRNINQIRTVDLLVLVVRAFENTAVPIYRDTINPSRDLDELKTELLLADLELVTTRIENLEKQANKPTKTQSQDKLELALQKRLQEAIESGKPISSAVQSEADRETIKSLAFLTFKPVVIAVNVGENQLGKKFDFSGLFDKTVPVIEICANLEYELSQLDAASKKDFMADLGISESAVSKFVNSCYSASG